MTNETKPRGGPLSHLRVFDLSRIVAGPENLYGGS